MAEFIPSTRTFLPGFHSRGVMGRPVSRSHGTEEDQKFRKMATILYREICFSIWASVIGPAILEEARQPGPSPTTLEQILPESPTEQQQLVFRRFCQTIWAGKLLARSDTRLQFIREILTVHDYDRRLVRADLFKAPQNYDQPPYSNARDYLNTRADLGCLVAYLRMYKVLGDNIMIKTLIEQELHDIENETPRPRPFALRCATGSRPFKRALHEMARNYLASFLKHFPFDHLYPRVFSRDGRCSVRRIDTHFNIISYRQILLGLARCFIEICDIPCSHDHSMDTGYTSGNWLWGHRCDRICQKIRRSELFPPPMKGQGPQWLKPIECLAASWVCSGLCEVTVEKKLALLCRSELVLFRRPKPSTPCLKPFEHCCD